MFFEDSPPYTSSTPAPSYSREPSADEERLAFTARNLRRAPPRGHFRKKAQGIGLVLHGQDDKAEMPLYENNALVTGRIDLDDDRTRVQSVVIKLECWIKLRLEGGNRESTKIFSDEYTLWTATCGQPCPDTHPFAIPLASVHDVRGATRQRPPSCDISIPRGFSAKCVYRLKVRVYKTNSILPFWKKPLKLDVVLNYRPRICPPRPISYAPLISSIKSSPEEWHQSVSNILTHTRSKIPSIVCNMFIPASQIFAFSDVIPFHIQLSGTLSSFRALFNWSNHPPSTSRKTTKSIGLHVFLSREVSAEVCGDRTKRICDHSEGTLTALPPRTYDLDLLSPDVETVVDWEGEVCCTDVVTSTGFTTDMLVVKDFIVVSWTPTTGLSPSPFLPFRHAIPIRLVTDPWTERPEHPRY